MFEYSQETQEIIVKYDTFLEENNLLPEKIRTLFEETLTVLRATEEENFALQKTVADLQEQKNEMNMFVRVEQNMLVRKLQAENDLLRTETFSLEQEEVVANLRKAKQIIHAAREWYMGNEPFLPETIANMLYTVLDPNFKIDDIEITEKSEETRK